MEEMGDDSATGNQKQTDILDKRQLTIQRCIKHLVHACNCKDADCRLLECRKMKRVVQHCKTCSQKTTGGCPICKQLIALCCYHAKHCQEVGVCPVSFCISIKNKLKTEELRKRLQQAQILQRHISFMQNRRMSGGLLEPNPKNSNFSRQLSSDAQPNLPAHSQSKTGLKLSPGPPIGALLAVQQVQAAAARQVAEAQVQNTMSLMMTGIPSYMQNMGNARYTQNHQPHQNAQPLANPQFGLPLQIMGVPNSLSVSINSTMGPPQVMPEKSPSMDDMQRSTQDWQQLFQTLRISSASSPPSSSVYSEN